jgi:hypothetical protein
VLPALIFLVQRSVLHVHLVHMHQKQVLYHVTRVQAIHHRQSAPHQSQIVFVMMVIRDHQRRMTHVFPSLMVVGVQHHHVQLHVVVVLRPVYVHVHYHLVVVQVVKVNQHFHVKLQYVLYRVRLVALAEMVPIFQDQQHVHYVRLIHMHQKQVPHHVPLVQAIHHRLLVQSHVFVMMVILAHLMKVSHVFPSLMVVGVPPHRVQLHVAVVLQQGYVHVRCPLVEGWTVKVNRRLLAKSRYVQ